MAQEVLILGDSGAGKSRSIKGLNPAKTFFINVAGKTLPFKGAKKFYTEIGDDNPKGNMYTTNRPSKVAKMLQYVSDKRPEIKSVVVDDNQYLSLFTFVRRINDKDGFAKFNDIAAAMVELVQFAKDLRDDLTIYFLHHIDTGTDARGDERLGAKTMGKFVKEKVTYEGLFSIVLMADKEKKDNGEIDYFFWTRMADSTVKTPEEMFADQKIPNDLSLVAKAIHEYNS